MRPIPRLVAAISLSHRPRWQKTIALLTLGVVVVSISADLAARFWIQTKIASAASHRLHTHADISLGGGPALTDVINGRVPSVHLRANSATLCSVKDADVSATITNLHRKHSTFAVSSTHAQITLDPASLTNLVAQRLPSATAHPDPAHHTIDVHAGPANAITLTLRPQLKQHRLTFALTTATFLGRPLPATITNRLQAQLDHGANLGSLPMGLSPTSVSVSPQGLHVSLSGGPWQSPHAGRTRSCRRRA